MKKRIIATVLTLIVLVTVLLTPAAAADQTGQGEQDYQYLLSIAKLIKDYGLESSDEDDPIKNMLVKLLDEDPEAFYTLANLMLGYYDSHSAYVTADEYKTEYPKNIGGYVGVGITMSASDGPLKITYVTPQSPADQAGILPGDIIKAVDGQPVADGAYDGVAGKIQGEEGTPVTLTVERDSKELSFTMNRKKIGRPNFESYTVEPGIEYMRLALFNDQDTLNRFNLAYSQLAEKETKVLILDLRGNPGGLLDMAEYMINAFVPDKGMKMYAARNRNAKTGLSVFETDGTGIKLNNIYILVDKGSASASEIMAGSLRDLGYAKLVGTNTYGKSTGQIHLELSDGDTIILTVQQHVLPKGESFEGTGLVPDYKVENYEADYPLPADLLELQTDSDIYLTHCSDRTKAVEQRLKLLGYFQETPDRNFNQATLDAVNSFRKANNLTEQAYCSVQTIGLLGQKITELSRTKVTVDAQFEKALELAREDAKAELKYTVDENGDFINK